MLRAWTISAAILVGVPAVSLVGCSTAPEKKTERMDLKTMAADTLNRAYAADPSLRGFIDRSAGYAVFPEVGKGGLVVAGGYGKGVLYEKGQVAGYCDMTQATVGATVGGQKFAEILAFETPDALAAFKNGDYSLNAQASAVAIKSGASSDARYNESVAVFTLAESGLMADASVGGQKFRFTPISATADVDEQH